MSEKENKTIVFVETKRRCDELTRKMRRDGYVGFLHWSSRCIRAEFRGRANFRSGVMDLSFVVV